MMKIKRCKMWEKCPVSFPGCYFVRTTKACNRHLVEEYHKLKNVKPKGGFLVGQIDVLRILQDEANKTQNAAAFSALKKAYARVYHLPTTIKKVDGE